MSYEAAIAEGRNIDTSDILDTVRSASGHTLTIVGSCICTIQINTHTNYTAKFYVVKSLPYPRALDKTILTNCGFNENHNKNLLIHEATGEAFPMLPLTPASALGSHANVLLIHHCMNTPNLDIYTKAHLSNKPGPITGVPLYDPELTSYDVCQPRYKNNLPSKIEELVIQELNLRVENGLAEIPTSLDGVSIAPIVAAVKKDKSIRITLVLDEQNKRTKPDLYPINNLNKIIPSLTSGRVAYLFKTDIAGAFDRLPVSDRIAKMHCIKLDGHAPYILKSVPQGGRNSTAHMQRVTDQIVAEILKKAAETCSELLLYIHIDGYVDDLPGAYKFRDIPSAMELHQKFIDNDYQAICTVIKQCILLHITMINVLKQHNIFLKPSKTTILATQTDIFNYMVSTNGHTPLQTKVEAIDRIPLPTNKTLLQSFLGSINPYTKYIPKFRTIAKPLHTLIGNKPHPYSYDSPKVTEAFNKLKELLKKQPILRTPDYHKLFYSVSDTGNGAIGGMLVQLHNGTFHPIEYCDRRLTNVEQAYSSNLKELLGVSFALQSFARHTRGRQVTVITDHKAHLNILRSDPSATNEQKARIVSKILLNAPSEIIWCSRDDGLIQLCDQITQQHRLPPNLRDNLLGNLQDISTFTYHINTLLNPPTENDDKTPVTTDNMYNNNIHPTYRRFAPLNWRKAQKADPLLNRIIDALESGNKKYQSHLIAKHAWLKNTFMHNKILHTSHNTWHSKMLGTPHLQIVVPIPQRSNILQWAHGTYPAAHAGYKHARDLIQQTYFWPGYTADLKAHIDTCWCKLVKKPHTPPALCIPVQHMFYAFNQCVYIDAAGPYPTSPEGYNYFLLIVDAYTSWVEVIGLANKTSAHFIAQFEAAWCTRYGTPTLLVSDNAAEFISALSMDVYKTYNIRKVNNGAANPQANKAERHIKSVKQLLVGALAQLTDQTHWYSLLPHVCFVLRTTMRHNSKRPSPDLALFGFKLNSYLDTLQNSKTPPNASQLMLQRRKIALWTINATLKYIKTYEAVSEPTRYVSGSLVFRKRSPNKVRAGENVYEGPFKVIDEVKPHIYSLKNIQNNRMSLKNTHIRRLTPYFTVPQFTSLDDMIMREIVNHN